MGISVGADMWFYYSQKDVADTKSSDDFEHHVLVQSGDALLFDGMTLNHMADNLEASSVPIWWPDVIKEAGAGHCDNKIDATRWKVIEGTQLTQA